MAESRREAAGTGVWDGDPGRGAAEQRAQEPQPCCHWIPDRHCSATCHSRACIYIMHFEQSTGIKHAHYRLDLQINLYIYLVYSGFMSDAYSPFT